jgi:integrase
MSFLLPAHLHRNRYGVLYFRLSIPPDLRPLFTVAEVYRSLSTSSVRDAAVEAQALTIAFVRLFKKLRAAAMSSAEKPSPETFEEFCADPSVRARIREAGRLVRDADQRIEIERLQEQLAEQSERHAGELAALRTAFDGAAASSHVASVGAVSSSPLLADAIAAYARMKRARGEWTDKTDQKMMASFDLLERAIGNPRVSDVDAETMVAYLELLKRVPANLNKRKAFQGLTLQQTIELAERSDPPIMPISDGTRSHHIDNAHGLFGWCMDQRGYGVTHNPVKGLAGPVDASFERRPFTDAELAFLFSTDEFSKRRFAAPYEYWLMPLGLFTGARLGELCQLLLSDIVDVDGIACLDINDEEEGKTLKSKNAKRLVPLHSELIRLGFLRYVERLREAGEVRVFPGLSLEPSSSHHASKWFGRYRRRAGVTAKQETVFHSFRHGFVTYLLDHESGISEHQIAPIVGHEAKLITGKVYWNTKDARKRQPVVEMFRVPAAVMALIPVVEDATFTGVR